MQVQPSTRRRKPSLLVLACVSEGMLAVYCNALIDTNGEQCTGPQDCAAAGPYTECSPQKVCIKPLVGPDGDATGGTAQTAADATPDGVEGTSDRSVGASTGGSSGTTSGQFDGQAGGWGAGGASTNGDAAADATTADGSAMSPEAGGTGGPPPGPPSTAAHVLSFDSKSDWDVTDWSGYREAGRRPPFDLEFGWVASSSGASGVLRMWAEPDVDDPNPKREVSAIKELDGTPAGTVPVGAPVSCTVFIPSSCNFGTDGVLRMFVDGGEYDGGFDWHGKNCTARDQWATCTVEGTTVNRGTKIGFEFWYQADGDCLYKDILVDACWF